LTYTLILLVSHTVFYTQPIFDIEFERECRGLSKKIDRGTHTTRHAELIKLEKGGKVADTPGFTSFELGEMELSKLESCFPEFESYKDCYFQDCMHDKEPQCGVKEAVEEGKISKIRYEFYIELLRELKNIRRF
jgi:ribosome biogenesis GTPase